MIRPCNITLNGCPGEDSPITNLSSEAPDPLLFSGHGWDPYNPYLPPPLGDGPVVPTDCSNITWSDISQLNADLMAQLAAAGCQPPPPGPPGPWPQPPIWNPPPWPNFTFTPPVGDPQSPWVPTQPDYQQFVNESQSATASCPNGAVFTYTVKSGTIISQPVPVQLGPVMVELLNAQALAIALQQVWALRVCIDVPGMVIREAPTVPPTPTPPIPPGGGGTGGRGPTLAANPGWCCFGATLEPVLNTYTVGSGIAQFSFSIGGNVPPGTTLDQAGPHSAVLGGTPSAPGVYTYTITALAVSGIGSAQITDTLKVFGMTTSSLSDGTVGTDYSGQLSTAGGTAPVTFVAVGALPDGLTMDSSGSISGTPTTAGTSAFTVKFTDAEGGTCQQGMSITIKSPVEACPFPGLVWDAPTINYSAGSGASISLTASGDQATIIENNGLDQSGNWMIIGTVVYSGPGGNFNLHVSGSNDAWFAGAGGVDINLDGVYQTTLQVDTATFGDIYDTVFNIPGPGTIEFVFSGGFGAALPDPIGHFNATITFECLPP